MADITAVTWRLIERWPAVFGEHRRPLARQRAVRLGRGRAERTVSDPLLYPVSDCENLSYRNLRAS